MTEVVEGPCPSSNLYSYLEDLDKMLTDGRKVAGTAFSCPNHCELYQDYLENDWHVFFQCATSIECWSIAGLSQYIQNRLQNFDTVGAALLDVCARRRRDCEFGTSNTCFCNEGLI